MKFGFAFLFLIPFLALQASPVGNTMSPELIQEGFLIPCNSWVNVRIGYEGDFVGDARLYQNDGGQGRVDTFQQYTNAGTLTLNILDRVDLYGLFGSSRACADWRFAFASTVTRIQMETLYQFLWGVGARGIFFECGQICLGAGGRYSQCHFKPSWLTSNASVVDIAGSSMNWREWQFDLDISYHIDLFTPYFGIKYANERAKLSNFPTAISNSGEGDDRFENRVPVGIFIGCGISNSRYFMLNIEGRLIDEDAVTISGDLKF